MSRCTTGFQIHTTWWVTAATSTASIAWQWPTSFLTWPRTTTQQPREPEELRVSKLQRVLLILASQEMPSKTRSRHLFNKLRTPNLMMPTMSSCRNTRPCKTWDKTWSIRCLQVFRSSIRVSYRRRTRLRNNSHSKVGMNRARRLSTTPRERSGRLKGRKQKWPQWHLLCQLMTSMTAYSSRVRFKCLK